MSEDRFGIWLIEQRHRQDPVGDLARDFLHSGSSAYTVEQVRRTLTLGRAASCAQGALDRAIEEWETL